MRTPNTEEHRWLRRAVRSHDARVRLMCFHYAGGNASMFRTARWLRAEAFEIVAVQLPGRADRLDEPPYVNMASLIGKLIEVIRPLIERPFACYGVSMGARVAWALAHGLRDRSLPMPQKLYLACSEAPCMQTPIRGWNESDSGLIQFMRDLNGTPSEILADSNLLELLLPTIRADLTLLGTDTIRPPVPLDIPIDAFAGSDDHIVPPQRMTGWREETTSRFALDTIPGGHFFSPAGEQRVIEKISSDLA